MDNFELTAGMPKLRYLESEQSFREVTEVRREGCIELYLVTKGSGLYLVGTRTYETDEGDVLFVAEGMTRRCIEGDAEHEIQGFSVPTHYLPEAIKEALWDSGPVFRYGQVSENFRQSDFPPERPTGCCGKETGHHAGDLHPVRLGQGIRPAGSPARGY